MSAVLRLLRNAKTSRQSGLSQEQHLTSTLKQLLFYMIHADMNTHTALFGHLLILKGPVCWMNGHLYVENGIE